MISYFIKLYFPPCGSMSPAMSTAMTREYTAIMPDMTTGIRDCGKMRVSVRISLIALDNPGCRTFMIRSGLKVPTPAIPMPDFAVPYAAPIPEEDGSAS